MVASLVALHLLLCFGLSELSVFRCVKFVCQHSVPRACPAAARNSPFSLQFAPAQKNALSLCKTLLPSYVGLPKSRELLQFPQAQGLQDLPMRLYHLFHHQRMAQGLTATVGSLCDARMRILFIPPPHRCSVVGFLRLA